ncbi:MAG: ABC transporter ATP-binding protein [Chloroherpetonaceae bacterium]|nr:ABC transporter ATP-binding protein [Chloroherpetonaceae bacterium]
MKPTSTKSSENPKGFKMEQDFGAKQNQNPAPDKVSGKAFDGILLRRLFAYVSPNKNLFFLTVGLTITVSLLSPLRPYITKVAVDEHIAKGNIDGLWTMALVLLGIIFAESIAQFANSYFTQLLGQKAVMAIRMDIFKHLQRLSLKFFDRNPIGRLMTRATGDVETLNEMLSSGLVSLFGDLFQLTFIVIMMVILDWKLTLVTMSVLPIMFWATMIFKKKVRVAYQDVRTEIARLSSFLQEHITGIATVQLFNREDRENEKHREINGAHRDANIRSVFYYSVFYPSIEMLSAIALGLILWHAGGRVIDHTISLGIVISFVQYIALFFRPLQDLSDKYNIMQTAITSAERIFQLLDQKIFIPEPEHPKSLEKVKGNIEFRGVSFAYIDENWVLKNISFEAKAGEKIALVGATGSGKSTIISLLSKFYEYQKGDILIDGINLKELRERDVRRNFGVVLQDVFLFSGTIRENITLGDPSISVEKMLEATKLIGAHQFISQLPGGYDYNVQERGGALSTGQRQLISFARAMVYDPKIIVLDEATSSVDNETEAMIEHALEELMKGKTAIIIAHRLSTIQHADKIIVMHKGEIREMGNHQELLKERGLYHKLYELQYAESLVK